MLIKKDKSIMHHNISHPEAIGMLGNDYFSIEEDSILARKAKELFPCFDFVVKDDKLVDIVALLTNYIKPELLILIPVLYFIGIGLKNTQALNDKYIPLTLGIIGILLSLIWVLAISIFATWQDVLMATFTAIVQGVLVAGCSVYANQIVKQVKRE